MRKVVSPTSAKSGSHCATARTSTRSAADFTPDASTDQEQRLRTSSRSDIQRCPEPRLTELALYRELHRPQFHFSPRENWTNDPHGLVYQDGVWHLFFQHNPEAPVWGNMTWGHAVSDDLMHWRQLEHALYPDEHGDMFTGSAVVDHANTAGFGKGALLAFYAAAGSYAEPKRPFTQCLASSVDNGKRWTKYDGNPIVGWIEADNRDPKVVWHAPRRRWIMALYLADDRYCLLSSADAKTWTKFQDLKLEGTTECPDFFPLRDESGTQRWIFWGAAGVYRVGSFDGSRFTPETGVLTCEQGTNGYAAQTWSDAPDGRRIQISWMAGGVYPEMHSTSRCRFPWNSRWRAPATTSRWCAGRLENWIPSVGEPSALTGRQSTPEVPWLPTPRPNSLMFPLPSANRTPMPYTSSCVANPWYSTGLRGDLDSAIADLTS